jgi:hypothetical protein
VTMMLVIKGRLRSPRREEQISSMITKS